MFRHHRPYYAVHDAMMLWRIQVSSCRRNQKFEWQCFCHVRSVDCVRAPKLDTCHGVTSWACEIMQVEEGTSLIHTGYHGVWGTRCGNPACCVSMVGKWVPVNRCESRTAVLSCDLCKRTRKLHGPSENIVTVERLCEMHKSGISPRMAASILRRSFHILG